MKRLQTIRRVLSVGFQASALALFLMGADDPKQTVDAKGMSFQAPAAWKSSTPSGMMRVAELKVDPIEGDDYPAELVVFSFNGDAGGVKANLERWRKMFKDKDGNAPAIESKEVKGKNVDVVTRAETSGHYYPAPTAARKDPDRPGARLLGAIVLGEGHSYFIRMIGPDKTMTKLRPDFDDMLATITLEKK
jgi:hypothetical protein